MEKGFINMPSHTPLITARFTVVIMCVFLASVCVCVCRKSSRLSFYMVVSQEIGYWTTADASVSLLSCPCVLNNYQRVMVFCCEHNTAAIKRPCKTLMWSRRPDVTQQLSPEKRWKEKKRKHSGFHQHFSLGFVLISFNKVSSMAPKFRRIRNLW